ncbi:MAG: type II toxin-antitoxin system RelB/DinJ family antitoxin [Fretibacterium sp.]|nr:type II toxin-antitoxin system RelB/DinJ family antitoxin [Fretibacterium sp.]
MPLATITARVEESDKRNFDAFCSAVGLNTSVAINLFVKAVLREGRIPFEVVLSHGALKSVEPAPKASRRGRPRKDRSLEAAREPVSAAPSEPAGQLSRDMAAVPAL